MLCFNWFFLSLFLPIEIIPKYNGKFYIQIYLTFWLMKELKHSPKQFHFQFYNVFQVLNNSFPN